MDKTEQRLMEKAIKKVNFDAEPGLEGTQKETLNDLIRRGAQTKTPSEREGVFKTLLPKKEEREVSKD